MVTKILLVIDHFDTMYDNKHNLYYLVVNLNDSIEIYYVICQVKFTAASSSKGEDISQMSSHLCHFIFTIYSENVNANKMFLNIILG